MVFADNRLLFQGSLVFIASGLVLAIPYGRIINISLYFTAQVMIVMAARAVWMGAGEERARGEIANDRSRRFE